jgi:hypothetical protein
MEIVRYGVLTPVAMKVTVFQNIMPCSFVFVINVSGGQVSPKRSTGLHGVIFEDGKMH